MFSHIQRGNGRLPVKLKIQFSKKGQSGPPCALPKERELEVATGCKASQIDAQPRSTTAADAGEVLQHPLPQLLFQQYNDINSSQCSASGNCPAQYDTFYKGM